RPWAGHVLLAVDAAALADSPGHLRDVEVAEPVEIDQRGGAIVEAEESRVVALDVIDREGALDGAAKALDHAAAQEAHDVHVVWSLAVDHAAAHLLVHLGGEVGTAHPVVVHEGVDVDDLAETAAGDDLRHLEEHGPEDLA